MIRLPLGVEFTEVGAIAYVVPHSEPPEVQIDTWNLADGIPGLYGTDEIIQCIEVTNRVIEFLENNPEYVPEGWEPEDVYYFFCALIDGAAAFEEAYESVETVEEAGATFGGIMDALFMDGVLPIEVLLPASAEEPQTETAS